MGRRKQIKPVKVSPVNSCNVSLSPASTTNSMTSSSSGSEIQTPVKRTDFSIKAQLDSKPSTSNSNLSPTTLANALKAYNTLIKDLEKHGNILQLTQQVNKLAYKDPNFKKRNNDKDSALDLSIKRKSNDIQNNESKIPRMDNSQDDDTLRKLTSLVGKAGSSMKESMAAVVKSTVNDNKDDTDPRQVFTCLKCYERFNGMEELSEHMIKTKHFTTNNINHLSSTTTITPTSTTTKKIHSTINSLTANGLFNNGMNLTSNQGSKICSYRYKCALCGFCNDSNIDEHMKKQHSFKESKDWIQAVKLIPI